MRYTSSDTNDTWTQQGLSFACYTPGIINAADF
jgi:hypothetical protein